MPHRWPRAFIPLIEAIETVGLDAIDPELCAGREGHGIALYELVDGRPQELHPEFWPDITLDEARGVFMQMVHSPLVGSFDWNGGWTPGPAPTLEDVELGILRADLAALEGVAWPELPPPEPEPVPQRAGRKPSGETRAQEIIAKFLRMVELGEVKLRPRGKMATARQVSKNYSDSYSVKYIAELISPSYDDLMRRKT